LYNFRRICIVLDIELCIRLGQCDLQHPLVKDRLILILPLMWPYFFPLNTLKPFSYNTIIVRGFGMTSEITLVLLVLAVTIVLFVTGLFPVDVIAIIGMLTFG
jgi:hypothetical protein